MPGTAIRSFSPTEYTPGSPVTVTLMVQGDAGTVAYGLEDEPQAGWGPATNITNSLGAPAGFWDGAALKVKWGPFLCFPNPTCDPVTLTYDVIPPISESGTQAFFGVGSYPDVVPIVGASSIDEAVVPSTTGPPEPPEPRDLRTIGDGNNAGELLPPLVKHYVDGALRPTTLPETIGAHPGLAFSNGVPAIANAPMTQGALVNIFDVSGAPWVRLADQSSSLEAHGWIDFDVVMGEVANVRLSGSVNENFGGLTTGATYYLAEDGGIDTSTGEDPISQVVGFAANSTTLVFMPMNPTP